MQLTPHFSDTELGVAGQSPQIVANAVQLCTLLLEPIRAQLGPTILSDGYRDPARNKAVGGAPNSQHLYLGQNSAADINECAQADLATVFNWIRLDSHLPFDQCILEVNPATQEPACIHISYDGGKAQQRRQALTGETNGAGAYVAVQVNP
jgi:zinc D-Ala-D-Ala carboxypeptidase